MHDIPSQKKFSFISCIAKTLSHIKSQIEVVNILDHFMPYSTALYEEPLLATLDTMEFDHLKCGLYNSQVNIKVKIAICLYRRASLFSSIDKTCRRTQRQTRNFYYGFILCASAEKLYIHKPRWWTGVIIIPEQKDYASARTSEYTDFKHLRS